MRMGHPLTPFSEQQLVSCSWNRGCTGGNTGFGFEYAKWNSMNTEAAYPYVSGGGAQPACNKAAAQGPLKVQSWHRVGWVMATVNDMTAAIAQQPISVSISSSGAGFHQYRSGVLTGA